MTNMTRGVARNAAADISNDVESRGPQENDPPEQQIGAMAVNALHHTFVEEGQNGGAAAASETGSSHSRSPRRAGVHEQARLSVQEMTALYGVGSRLLMSMGWQPDSRLGLTGDAGGGLSSALTNDWDATRRSGIGFPQGNPSRTTQEAMSATVRDLFPNPAGQPEINRELCCVCREELGRYEVVVYRCTHELHAECDNALVASFVARGLSAAYAKCPLCRECRHVMPPQSDDDVIGFAPEFEANNAAGSSSIWAGLQLHSRLPRFAVPRNPILADIAEPWIRFFLRSRAYNAYTTMEDAFASFRSVNDVMGGVMLPAELKDVWKHYSPQGYKDGYHGTSLAAIYNILTKGLKRVPR
jgi:hypothetical protein